MMYATSPQMAQNKRAKVGRQPINEKTMGQHRKNKCIWIKRTGAFSVLFLFFYLFCTFEIISKKKL